MSEARKAPARVHPDDRAKIEAGNVVAALYHGPPKSTAAIAYYSPELIQCTLPHSDPKSHVYTKKNGNFALIVAGGYDKDGQEVGVPYGAFPRLVLAYIITRVRQTGDRRIELSSHFSTFLREIGYTGGYKGTGANGKRVREQLLRLLRANITFQYESDDKQHLAVQSVNIAPRFELWFDERRPDEASLFSSYIQISEDFHQAILRAPVPLRTDILGALKRSPLALDVYMWLSYRLFTMKASEQQEISLSYGMLQQQFGTGIAEENYRMFRNRLKKAFKQVAQYWQEPDGERSLLNYDLDETRLVLYRSPLLIGKAKQSAAESAKLADVQQIMASRSFDMETRRKARQIAGKWDVGYLTSQYFEWIDRRSVKPKDPRSHFLAFIKKHRQLQGETL